MGAHTWSNYNAQAEPIGSNHVKPGLVGVAEPIGSSYVKPGFVGVGAGATKFSWDQPWSVPMAGRASWRAIDGAVHGAIDAIGNGAYAIPRPVHAVVVPVVKPAHLPKTVSTTVHSRYVVTPMKTYSVVRTTPKVTIEDYYKSKNDRTHVETRPALATESHTVIDLPSHDGE
jgi:hypothetical protein